jgi:acetyl esterase/lipase
LVLAFSAAFPFPTPARADDAPKPTVLDVWPGPAPGENGATVGEEKETRKGDKVTSLTNVSKPTLSVYRPAADKNTGVAILVFPGGGYTHLAVDHEGEQVAQWLNSIGVTAAVLKYRVPRRPGTPQGTPPQQALMDAQRAISLVRSKAGDWGVDPKRVGVLGFSAGGHLGAWVSTNADKRAYEPVDDNDKVSIRPDFAVLIYAGGVVKRGSDQLAPEIRVNSETPPTFLVHATNDSSENSALLYLALKRAGVPAELHIFSTGGHGFGMRPNTQPYAAWPKRCEEWLRTQGILKADSGH